MTRERLSNRRPALTFDLEVGGLHYVVSVGHFADGALAEIFILRLEATRGDAIHDLRAILKALLRRHGFRCLDCREVP
jgi:hypothetical protein